jgi:trehalose 6-phosphate synthase
LIEATPPMELRSINLDRRSPSHPETLSAYVSRTLKDWDPIIVSNRAPYELASTGAMRRGAGGVVTAMTAVAEATGATWIACARNDAERRMAESPQQPAVLRPGQPQFNIRYAPTAASVYNAYYGVIANPLLWFIQHYLWQLAYEPVIDESVYDAWHNGYVAVNEIVAGAAVSAAIVAKRRPLMLFQDYHFYLAPRMVRERMPDVMLQHFIHIPWPTPQYWTVLPQELRDAIIDGLLANDVIGFQTNRDVKNFLAGCEELMGLRVDHRERAVLHRGRVSWVRSYPISVDAAALTRLASSREVATEEHLVRQWRPDRLIVRIDRTDPIKNIVRGFLAYERMLRDHPELLGRVQFWAFLQPSRQDVVAYTDYLNRIRTTVQRINSEYGRTGWDPIRLELRESLKRAVAAYRAFDVLLVNSIYDGMNLVAKEGMFLNDRGGVLVLSENAGAYEQLGRHVIGINPFDVGATADALYRGLTMPLAQRRVWASEVSQQVAREDVVHWLKRQLEDIRELAPRLDSRHEASGAEVYSR